MKVLIDTYVLYSAFIRKSETIAKLINWLMVNHEAIVTPYIADEILEKVETRSPQSMGVVAAFLVSPNPRFVDTTSQTDLAAPRIRDKKDQEILNAAFENDIDIILTGDHDFLALEIERPRMLRPGEFIREFLPPLD